MDTTWIDNLRVVDLKEELKNRDLPVTGKKAELAARLTEAVQTEANVNSEAALPDRAPQDNAKESIDGKGFSKSNPPNAAAAALQKGDVSNRQESGATAAEQAAQDTDNKQEPPVEFDSKTKSVPETASVASVEHTGKPLLTQDAAIHEAGPEEQKEQVSEEVEAPPQYEATEDAPAATSQAPATNERHIPDPIPSMDELAGRPAAANNIALAEEPVSATPAREERLPAMQAALLAPQPAAAEVIQEPEEAVDFEMDEAEDATAPKAPDQATEAGDARRVVHKEREQADQSEGNGLQSEPAELVSLDSTGKRKREPIPVFKPRDRSLDGNLPKRVSLDKRPSVFDRIGAGGELKGPGAPPTRISATKALLITGFIRPFTLNAAQNLFNSYGTVEKMWMPQIRDKAYVIFDSETTAEAARQALHGLEWPHGNRTSLRPNFPKFDDGSIRFVPLAEAEETISSNGASLPAPKPITTAAAAAAAAAANAKPTPPSDKEPSVKANGVEAQAKPKAHEEKPKQAALITLEDLFVKTDTTPHLYWLPKSGKRIDVKPALVAAAGKDDVN